MTRTARRDKAAEKARELQHIATLRAMLDGYESHVRFVGADAECEEYRAVLLAMYDLTEIDALHAMAMEIFIAEPEHARPVCVLDLTR